MRTQDLDLDPGSVAGHVHQRLKWFTFAAVLVTHLLLVSCVWGQWSTIALITGVFVCSTVMNTMLIRRFFSPRSRVGEATRLIINQLVTLTYGLLTGWALPVWLYLPLDSLWVDNHLDRWTRFLLFGLFLLIGGIAILDGCSPLVPAVFLVLSAMAYAISGVRVYLLRHVLERLAQRHQELARAHAELAQAHQRAREQDRLSSLGTLAAGVAHEINNPLSYVKSNVNSLYKDLRARGELPPVLEEYVREVIPATLDGIQRIATIVADLRRFARGEPEPPVEFDLNAEVQAALRITRGRLQPHCELEMDLGPLPGMVGRPRQLAQVVINLLINAAQAIPGQGKIALRTRYEGGEVVLVVKDTGHGMTPEVLAKLFQPFFSTKPLGEGTGMGLAVVHGIVSSHGGSIHVESEPLRGTTFTIRLPRVPPHLQPSAAA
jgi:two-component system, NtrC family, sensor kinase